jgi:hypothetical protein
MLTWDERGEPRCLGHVVEPWYGEEWITRVMHSQGLDRPRAIEILERGGPNGGPLPPKEAIALLAKEAP